LIGYLNISNKFLSQNQEVACDIPKIWYYLSSSD
jgi:hypothetical protein